MEYFEFIQLCKIRTSVMSRCRTPAFCERYKKDIRSYANRTKRILPKSVKQSDIRE